MRRVNWLAPLLGTIGLAGCSSPAVEVPVRVVFQSQYCSQAEGLVTIADEQALAQLMQSASRVMTANGEAPQTPGFTEREHLLLLSLGQKSSGGHELVLSQTHARRVDTTLMIEIDIASPAEGSMQTMQLTSPCLVIAVEKGAYDKVKIASRPDWQVQVQSH